MTTDNLLISLFNDINNCLLKDQKPSEYLSSIINKPEFNKPPFNLIKKLRFTEQSPKYHPEGNVWNHTLLVVDEAAKIKNKSSDEKAFMWAAFLHDLGKPDTTRNRMGKITSYDHDKVGAELTEDFLFKFIDDKEFISRVVCLVRFHMQILYVVKDLPYKDIHAINSSNLITDIALLGYCDRMGRKGADKQEEQKNIEMFYKKCKEKEGK
ncbi:MAG: phosphohydrolase [Clostridiales bacterium]|nr:MAG: phosphohydrolase [Clostridiales bacterium]